MNRRDRMLEALLGLSVRPGARSRNGIVEQLLRTALLVAEADGAAVMSQNGRRSVRTLLRPGEPQPERQESPPGLDEFVRVLMRSGRPMGASGAPGDRTLSAEEAFPGLEGGPALFVPLRQREREGGYLAVFRRRGAPVFDPEAASTLMLLAAWGAMAIENLRLSESVEKLAITDDLTQVYNYRFLKTALRREIKRAGRFRQELSLIMIDVDNLKTYNDRHGHLRGSYLLREIARLLAGQLRSFDLVAKYGGDEFTLILPQTGREGAMVVAERMRAAISDHTFPLAAPGSITVSLGVALFPTDAADVTGLIQSSDRALYLAKQRGRNRVETVWNEAA